MRFLLLGSGIVWVDCVMPEHGRGSGCGALMVVSGGGRIGVEIGVSNNVCSGSGGFIVMVRGTLRVFSCLWSISIFLECGVFCWCGMSCFRGLVPRVVAPGVLPCFLVLLVLQWISWGCR